MKQINHPVDNSTDNPTLGELLARSASSNGRVREAAVRQLEHAASHDPARVISALLVRANDWVPNVRLAAREVLAALMTDDHAAAFAFQLDQVFGLRLLARDNHQPLIDAIVDFLLLPQNAHALVAALASERRAVVRSAMKLCMTHHLLDDSALLARCLASDDVVLKTEASALLAALPDDQLDAALAAAINDGAMPLRRAAFGLYLQRRPEQGIPLARRLLFDRHRAIREIAIDVLVKRGQDVEAPLLAVLRGPASAHGMQCAIGGLLRLGSSALADELPRLLGHALASVRKSALAACAKLQGDGAREVLMAALADPSAGVTKEALRLLTLARLPPTLGELRAVVQSAQGVQSVPGQHNLDACARLARMTGKWDRLIFLLELGARLQLAGDTHLVKQELLEWNRNFNRGSAQPSALQTLEVRARLDDCRALVGDDFARMVAFSLPG